MTTTITTPPNATATASYDNVLQEIRRSIRALDDWMSEVDVGGALTAAMMSIKDSTLAHVTLTPIRGERGFDPVRWPTADNGTLTGAYVPPVTAMRMKFLPEDCTRMPIIVVSGPVALALALDIARIALVLFVPTMAAINHLLPGTIDPAFEALLRTTRIGVAVDVHVEGDPAPRPIASRAVEILAYPHAGTIGMAARVGRESTIAEMRSVLYAVGQRCAAEHAFAV